MPELPVAPRPAHTAPHRMPASRIPALLLALAIAVPASGALALAPSAPASAAARVSVTTADGRTAVADTDYATPVTVRGSGFQNITGGFGGIYVLFGWVDDATGGTWKPSKGGVVGADYRYVPDSEAKDNAGFQRFVSFPGSDTESAAQAVMGADGSWSVDMVLPAAVFESHDRANKVIEVDCAKVTCGVITIGAHGVKNANNESFTPVSFAAGGAAGAGAGAGGGGSAASEDAAGADAASAATQPARVGLAAEKVGAGDALVFTAQGFTAGEQVVAVLDDGAAAVGPLTAGASGEVAGVLSVPRTTRAGTHVLQLTGAGSGQIAETEVSIMAASGGVGADGSVSASTTEAQPMWPYLVLGVAILVALVLLTLSVITTVRRARAARRAQRAEVAAAEAAGADAAAASRGAVAAGGAAGLDAELTPPAHSPDPITALLEPVPASAARTGADGAATGPAASASDAPTERLEVRP